MAASSSHSSSSLQYSSGASNSSTSSTTAAAAASAAATTTFRPDKDTMWYFTADQLENSPSRRHGIDAATELHLRQMTAYLIQDMGQRLDVYVLFINHYRTFSNCSKTQLLDRSCASTRPLFTCTDSMHFIRSPISIGMEWHPLAFSYRVRLRSSQEN